MKGRSENGGEEDIGGLSVAKAVTDRGTSALTLSMPARTEIEMKMKMKMKLKLERR